MIRILTIIFITLFHFSCTKKEKNIVSDWIGKEINIPHDVKPYSIDSNFHSPQNVKYKILVYTDSSGCSACNLRLDLWRYLMPQIDSVSSENVAVFFWLGSDKREAILKILEDENFKYPVYIDDRDSINSLNNFPKQEIYRCFLLDSRNRVILVGNPILNEKIWKLYKDQIKVK